MIDHSKFFSLTDSFQRDNKPHVSPDAVPRLTTSLTLDHVQEVLRNTTVPSFISSVPKTYGNYSAGVIKADEWRILSSIFLPIALVILWGDKGSLPSHLRALDHSMALFQAGIILCRYSTTANRRKIFLRLLKDWVEDLHIVHPHTKQHQSRINVHVCLHMPDFLRLFGPPMSWWTFPFERLIGTLQRIKTNDIIGGALEETILLSYLRGCNIRRWLSRPDCPPLIQEIKSLLDKAFRRSDPSVDDLSTQRREGEHSYYTIGNAKYSPLSTHKGNSVVFYYPSPNHELVAGMITKIQTIKKQDYFFIQRQAPLASDQHDPFVRYPYFPARTYSTQFCQGLDQVRPTSVVSHGAKYEFSDDRCVIVDLSRVRSSSNSLLRLFI